MERKHSTQKMLVLFLAILLVFSGFTPALAQDDSSITIYHTNDVHARVEKSDSQFGYATLAHLVMNEKAAGKNILLLDAGDATHGQSIGTLSQGESIIKIMNQVGYDGMTAGNHDFNYGQNQLLKLKELANFPIMGANILTGNGEHFLDTFFIKEIAGKKVLIMGLGTPETLYKSHPKNTEGLTFGDPVESAKQILAENKSKVDFVIALVHLGQEGDYTSNRLAANVQGIDLIIDGHSHNKGELKVGNTTIVQTGEYGKGLGKVIVNFTEDKFTISSSILGPTDLKDISEDQKVLDIIALYQKEVSAVHSQVIGKTTVKLEGARELARTQETNLGNLITDAILHKTGADLALTNGGGIRASIEIGDITRKNVFEVLPFGNLIAVKDVPGSAIMEMLEYSVRLYPEANGGFLQGSGITFAFDKTKDPLNRVHDVRIKGLPLVPNKMYTLATNDFMAAGGDGYTVLGKYPVKAELISLEEALAEYITDIGGTVTAKMENRIRIEEMKKEEIHSNIYIVKSGDNLSKIAFSYGMVWQDLQKVNKLKNPNLIFPKQEIIIPAA